MGDFVTLVKLLFISDFFHVLRNLQILVVRKDLRCT